MNQQKLDPSQILLDGLTKDFQQPAVKSEAKRLLVIAGAGSGKTEVMARRVVWWTAVKNVPCKNIVAFTFTEAAAEELKFRIRSNIQKVTPQDQDPTIGGMYIGTIHGFCLKLLRENLPQTYYSYDILDDAGRIALVQRGYHGILGLRRLQDLLEVGQFETIEKFLRGYDLLNEYDLLDVQLPSLEAPADVAGEKEWVTQSELLSEVGTDDISLAFAESAARLYAYMRARRLLDFSTSQTELTSALRTSRELLKAIRSQWTHIVVDEVQDINPVQNNLINLLIGNEGQLTEVGDHRQAIFAWRGGRVGIMENLHAELVKSKDGEIRELPSNFRSTQRIIDLSNAWSKTISPLGTLPNPAMKRGNSRRTDFSSEHVGICRFDTRDAEAEGIANTIGRMVDQQQNIGARHDDASGDRGLLFSDIAILIRSSTDVRTYQEALRRKGIPSVVRAGPDLYSQPEVLLFLALLAKIAGVEEFYGSPHRPDSLPNRVSRVLKCGPFPDEMIPAACEVLRQQGFPVANDAADRLGRLAQIINRRMLGQPLDVSTAGLRSEEGVSWATQPDAPRRVFPQQLYHWLLEEAEIFRWDLVGGEGQSAMFHLGQLSRLITSIETPGWTPARDLRYQVIALATWGASNARVGEAPLLVPPDAVTVTTIHSAKGLEFPAVFLADVNAMRFPSSYAKRQENLPFSGTAANQIDVSELSDNDNYDNERRLMYVALTRAERYLFISCSGDKTSRFFKDLQGIGEKQKISIWEEDEIPPITFQASPQRTGSANRLSTSFSDLRYYLECPHDFYLRKILGFAPTIDQAFGYGRGVHNILRQIHKDPRKWARLASDLAKLGIELKRAVESGLFYMRYTTGEPLENMRNTARRGLEQYVSQYGQELAQLEFEPEKPFETLIREEGLLVNGTIDVIRLDDPPRISIIDFKSGEQGVSNQSGLSQEMMRLQIGIYGLAARSELEYEPDRGLIRYIGEKDPKKRELSVSLNAQELGEARNRIIGAGKSIKNRQFNKGPGQSGLDRCHSCDHKKLCGLRKRGRRGGQ